MSRWLVGGERGRQWLRLVSDWLHARVLVLLIEHIVVCGALRLYERPVGPGFHGLVWVGPPGELAIADRYSHVDKLGVVIILV